MANDSARIGFRVKGAYLAQLREVQDIMGFNTPTEVVQYLAQRGLEGLATQILARRTVKRMEGIMSPEQLLPLFAKLENIKPAEKAE